MSQEPRPASTVNRMRRARKKKLLKEIHGNTSFPVLYWSVPLFKASKAVSGCFASHSVALGFSGSQPAQLCAGDSESCAQSVADHDHRHRHESLDCRMNAGPRFSLSQPCKVSSCLILLRSTGAAADNTCTARLLIYRIKKLQGIWCSTFATLQRARPESVTNSNLRFLRVSKHFRLQAPAFFDSSVPAQLSSQTNRPPIFFMLSDIFREKGFVGHTSRSCRTLSRLAGRSVCGLLQLLFDAEDTQQRGKQVETKHETMGSHSVLSRVFFLLFLPPCSAPELREGLRSERCDTEREMACGLMPSRLRWPTPRLLVNSCCCTSAGCF